MEAAKQFEEAVSHLGEGNYILRLYVAGATSRSARAIKNLKDICEEHLADRYELEVIDICKRGSLAKGEQIVAAPTLVKELPLPLRKLIGDMSDKEQVLVGLDIRNRKKM
jgi:circadian clock protein KaiB